MIKQDSLPLSNPRESDMSINAKNFWPNFRKAVGRLQLSKVDLEWDNPDICYCLRISVFLGTSCILRKWSTLVGSKCGGDLEVIIFLIWSFPSLFIGDNNLAQPLAVLCGREIPGPIRSTGEYMFIRFTSDLSLTGAGFNASFHKSNVFKRWSAPSHLVLPHLISLFFLSLIYSNHFSMPGYRLQVRIQISITSGCQSLSQLLNPDQSSMSNLCRGFPTFKWLSRHLL